ncbi:MAG: GNAT family N-acetyltransferase [Lachnospiraceae bacterium]|nr:GNAT family N-acetyltransferase [Lachnospiraceae bacterium]
MKIIRLDREEMKKFSHLDILGLEENLSFPGWIAMGAYLEPVEIDDYVDYDTVGDMDFLDREGPSFTGDVPAAVMFFSTSKESLCIEWLCVEGAFRCRGIGEAMLIRATELAKELKKKRLMAYFNDSPDAEKYYLSAKRYFEEHLFAEEKDLSGEAESRLDQILTFMKKKGNFRPNPGAKFLSVIPSGESRRFLFELDSYDDAAKLYCVTDMGQVLERDVSVFLMKQNKLSGAMLFQVTDNNLTPVFIRGASPDDEKTMFATAMLAAFRKYGDKRHVHMMLRVEGKDYLMDLFDPNQRMENRYLVADLERSVV